MRRFVKSITVIAFAFLLILAVFLVPPHIQTRRIAPKLPDQNQISALLGVANGPVELSYILTSKQEFAGSTLGHISFIAKWADGRLFMIDAGMDTVGAANFAKLMRKVSSGDEAHTIGEVAELLGGAAERVSGMGFTHLHIDHSQGVTAFCRAVNTNVRVYQTDIQKTAHNFNTKEGAGIIKNSCLKTSDLGDGLVKNVDGFPGLGMIALGGHTPGSTAYALAVDGHTWIFSGDTTNSKAALLHDQGKGFIYSYLLVPENTAQTRKLRRWLVALDADENTSVIVSHDLPVLKASGLKPFTP